MKRHYGFFKTTAVGGLLFLLPLIVIGALIGQIVPFVLVIYELLGKWLPVKTPAGIALLLALSIVILLLLCFVAGIAARRSIAKRFSNTIEKNLRMIFPRYVILKEQMTGTLGGGEIKSCLKPVVVHFNDYSKIALEVERNKQGLVTVYLPGAPDPWSGSVALTTADRVERLDVNPFDAVATSEQLGRGVLHLLASSDAKQSEPQP